MEPLIKNAVLDLLAGLSVEDAEVRVALESSANDAVQYYRVQLKLADAPLVIGRRGETLQALQHILRLVVERRAAAELDSAMVPERMSIVVDVDGYRERQIETQLELAERRAEQVLASGNPARLPPLGAYLRRAVHLYIAEKYPELTTESLGYGAEKAVVIKKQA
jgi:spoIIIJ-associated protein